MNHLRQAELTTTRIDHNSIAVSYTPTKLSENSFQNAPNKHLRKSDRKLQLVNLFVWLGPPLSRIQQKNQKSAIQ